MNVGLYAASSTPQAGRHATNDGLPLHSYQGLLDHLATLTRG